MHPNNIGFHEVGFLIRRIGDEFFLFGSVLNGENEEKECWSFVLLFFFFLMWAG